MWDGDDVVHEFVEGEQSVAWVTEPGRFAPLAKVDEEGRYGVVTDHLGTPTAMYDEAGKLAWQARLDVYGIALTEVAATACPWRWPGQYEDAETGLYYNRFRYYDPATGTYVSQDPIGLQGGLSLYGYVSDPLTWSDPFGLAQTCASVAELRATGALPGDDGVVLTGRWVRFGDLFVLSTLNGMCTVEFGLSREFVEGQARLVLRSGTSHGVRVPDTDLLLDNLAHTHPNPGPTAVVPSQADAQSLNRYFWRRLNRDGPLADVPRSRVVWGAGNSDYTMFYPTLLR